MPGASSLGVSGGRSQAQIEGRSFGDVIRFGSAMTLAEGLYDDERLARAVTDHKAAAGKAERDDECRSRDP